MLVLYVRFTEVELCGNVKGVEVVNVGGSVMGVQVGRVGGVWHVFVGFC